MSSFLSINYSDIDGDTAGLDANASATEIMDDSSAAETLSRPSSGAVTPAANTPSTNVGGRGRVNTAVMPAVIRRMRERTEAESGCSAKCDITIMRAAGLKGVSAGLYVTVQIGKTVRNRLHISHIQINCVKH